MAYDLEIFYFSLGASAINLIFVGFLLYYNDYLPRNIEMSVKRKWPNMPKTLVMIIYYTSLLLIGTPILFIEAAGNFGGVAFLNFSFYDAVGIPCFFIFVYSSAVGFLIWMKSSWCLTWIPKVCFCICIAVLLQFVIVYDLWDPNFGYTTHTLSFFLFNSIFAILINSTLYCFDAVNLKLLYRNFLSFYEKKIKELQPSESPNNEKQPSKSEGDKLAEESLEEQKEEFEVESKKSVSRSRLDADEVIKPSQIHMIPMGLVRSHVSMESGERSHKGKVPTAFPEGPEELPQTNRILIPKNESINSPDIDPPVVIPEGKQDNDKQQLNEILETTRNENKSNELKKLVIYLICYLVVLAVYEILYNLNAPTGYTALGVVQSLFLIVFDTMYFHYFI